MAWVYLVIAGIFEVVWAISLKYTHGFTRWLPSVVTAVGTVISFYFLALATKALPIGTAYAVWTGIGTMGTIILGILLFHEQLTFPRLLFLALILAGIIGVKFTSGEQ